VSPWYASSGRLTSVTGHPDVEARLARLATDQRAAATAPPGPILCVAPAGSGKTTTLVARVAWLVDAGVDPAAIAVITFNRRAAEEVSARIGAALAPLGLAVDAVRVRTFHALGLEILREAGRPVAPLLDREAILRSIMPEVEESELRRLDTVISRFKLDLDVDPSTVAGDPNAGPTAHAFVAYERTLAETGGLDFDDLVAGALRVLEADAALLARWRTRCAHLLVDEAQDLDRSQLRMALLLAAPANRIFLVGDDDQSIYGWRLADVRRLLGLAESSLPGLRRVDLVTNYRCPAPVIARAVRLVQHNEERFAKRILPRPDAPGHLVLAPSSADDVERCRAVLLAWGRANGGSGNVAGPAPTRAILARTNRELIPAVVAALDAEVPFRAADFELPIEHPRLDGLMRRAKRQGGGLPLLAALARLRAAAEPEERDLAEALLSWAPRVADLAALEAGISTVRERLARLRRDDAALTLATAHGTKGLEFDDVAVIGLDAGRFPSARAVHDAEDPGRALEEERRLAYVAWTRARRSLTLVYDSTAPSPFLFEAFDRSELGLDSPRRRGTQSAA
jgi:superfamily I DNA/RNA helicase